MADRERETRETLTGPTAEVVGLTVAEAVASAVPVTGGPLAVALNQVRSGREHRLVDFVLELDADLRAHGLELAHLLTESSQFAHRAEAVLEQVVQAGQVAKRDSYRRALVRNAKANRRDDDDWALFMDTLNRVQTPHLRLLAALVARRPSPTSGNMQVQWNH